MGQSKTDKSIGLLHKLQKILPVGLIIYKPFVRQYLVYDGATFKKKNLTSYHWMEKTRPSLLNSGNLNAIKCLKFIIT